VRLLELSREARLGVLFAAIAAAALVTAAALAEDLPLSMPDSGGDDMMQSRVGGGFEFRRRLASVENPYCEILTYVLPDFDEQASSTTDTQDRAVIVIDAATLKNDLPYAHFLMAHECCHHTLGHVRLTSERLGQLGPQPFYYIKPLLKTMELDADACAVRMLGLTKEPDAVEEARQKMLAFGANPTGAYYPTGIERANNIARTAAEH
jgi:hypothetical protein